MAFQVTPLQWNGSSKAAIPKSLETRKNVMLGNYLSWFAFQFSYRFLSL
jgi:hypothetical protein